MPLLKRSNTVSTPKSPSSNGFPTENCVWHVCANADTSEISLDNELRMGTVARNSILQPPESGSGRGWTHSRSVYLRSNAKACLARVLTCWHTLFVTTSWLLSHIANIRRIVQDDVHSDAPAITGTSVCIATALRRPSLTFGGHWWWSSWSRGKDGAPPEGYCGTQSSGTHSGGQKSLGSGSNSTAETW
ncbi:hypothetical protein KCU90_g243, partial [Aureobasidium melanogenum]